MPDSLSWGEILEGVEDAPPTTYEDIPEGNYKARLESGKPFTAPNTGNEGLSLTFKILEGPHANRLVFTTYWIGDSNPKGMRITLDNLAALGAERKWLAAEDPSHEQVIARIVNQDADIKVAHNKYNDKLYYNVYVNKAYGQDNGPAGLSGPSSASSGGGLPSNGLPSPAAKKAPVDDPWADTSSSSSVATPPDDDPF